MGSLEIIAAGFDGVHRAEHVLDQLREMDRKDTLSLLNSVVLKKDSQGNVSSTEDQDVRPGNGVIFGALVGALVGFLGGPAGAVVGAAAGAITGGVTAAGIDLGFSHETIEAMKASLRPDSSLILALVEQEWVEQVSAEIALRHGEVIHQALRNEFTERYRVNQQKNRNKD
jgi:uncharacterized membrane protein